MRAAADVARRQGTEPAFDLIEQRRRGPREVDMEAWMPGKPSLDGRRLVRAVVVHHQVDVQSHPL